ncbi:MAG: TIGR04255 family protein [Deltaproteobacteria bacterium]|nr:TIGR04255 family protein [Deltaproteobacteria bacterium]
MGRELLENKPLVEAILELRWHLEGTGAPAPSAGGVQDGRLPQLALGQVDPHFHLVPGRFFDRVSESYPTHEPLPSVNMPDAIAAHMVQHRFRHNDGWPLIQLGPGILTVNDTSGYKWEKFGPQCVQAVNTLFEIHPSPEKIRLDNLVLRYIDAVDFDHVNNDVGMFLREKMTVECGLPESMFTDTPVKRGPRTFRWETSYACSGPAGRVTIVFSTGTREGKDALIWETVFTTDGQDLPAVPRGFEQWLGAAHEVTDDWFFKLIEGGSGELKRRFKGDG